MNKIMSKITEGTIRVLTVSGYVALGLVVASILIWAMSDLTITNKSDVESYNQLKERAVEKYMDLAEDTIKKD